jgi:hypothetical protein
MEVCPKPKIRVSVSLAGRPIRLGLILTPLNVPSRGHRRNAVETFESFVHDENIALYRKLLTDFRITDTQRAVIRKLLADEEAKMALVTEQTSRARSSAKPRAAQ